MKGEKLAEKQAKDAAKERIERLSPVVYALFEVVAEKAPKVEVYSQEEFKKEYKDVVIEILKEFRTEDLTVEECSWVLEKLRGVSDAVSRRVAMSMKKNLKVVEEKTFGKEMSEMKLSELDKVLIDEDKQS